MDDCPCCAIPEQSLRFLSFSISSVEWFSDRKFIAKTENNKIKDSGMQQLSGAPVPFTLHRNYELRSVPFRSLVPFLELKVRKCRTSNETRISIIKLLHRGRVMSPFKYMPLIYIPSQEDRAKASRCERIKQGGLRSAKEKYNRQRISTMNGNLWGKSMQNTLKSGKTGSPVKMRCPLINYNEICGEFSGNSRGFV